MSGSNLEGVVNCWTLADARAILKRADKGAPVVLVGAGFIGSIVLEALYQRGCDLTVVEIAPRMVARMMDDTAGGMLARWCRDKGVKVHTGTKVNSIRQTGSNGGATLAVDLSNGQAIPAQLVVLAAGVKSNTGFLVGSGVKVNWGIQVNPFLKPPRPASSQPAIAVRRSTSRPANPTCSPSSPSPSNTAALPDSTWPAPKRPTAARST